MRIPGAKVLHVVAFLLKSTMKSKAAIALVGVMVLLTSLSVGSRIAIVRGGGTPYEPARVFLEEPTTRRVLMAGSGAITRPGPSVYRDHAAILFDEARAFAMDVSMHTLDDLLVVALPFIALLLGVSLSPKQESPVLTILSAPIRRTGFYLGHVIAAGLVIALLCLAAWFAASLLLLIAAPQPWELIRLLTLMFAYSAVYAMIFAGAGLSLGILFRKRATALMTGLVLIILFVGVMPSVRQMTTRAYIEANRESYMDYLMGGPVPRDLLWYAGRASHYTPTNALKTILWITESFSPVPRAGCQFCGVHPAPGRGYSIPPSVRALAISLLASVSLGWVAFLRKEVRASI